VTAGPWFLRFGVGTAAFLLAGCTLVICKPATIIVTEKDVRDDIESRLESVSLNPLGHVIPVRREVLVRRFWIRGADAGWIAVSEATWGRAERGQPLEVCR
jgi:hypothetical protein